MQKIFHNILMPVYLDRKADTAIEMAVSFANQLSCHLHLVVITKPSFLYWYGQRKNEIHKRKQVAELKQKYHTRLNKGLKLFTVFQPAALNDTISRYTELHAIDMILSAGQGKHHHQYSKYFAGAACPVLSLKTEPAPQPFKAIVLPIGACLPVNKIRIALYLAKQFELSVHLLALERNPYAEEDMGYMKRAFQLLKNNTDLPVICHTVAGKKLDDIALGYASVNAGMIMMNTENEIPAPGFINRLVSRFGHKTAKVPVITAS